MAEPEYDKDKDVKRWFETGQKDLTLTTADYLILKLRGRQAAVIKALVGNTGNVYIGRKGLSTSTGFELAPGESLKVEYLPEKQAGEFIEIFGVCATAGDDVCTIIVP